MLLGLELRRVGSGTSRTFSSQEALLSRWMADHAPVSVVEHPELRLLEERLIAELSLPLNLDQGTHPFRPVLSAPTGALRNAQRRQGPCG